MPIALPSNEAALAHLRGRDPILGGVIGALGPCPTFQEGRDPFGALCMSIVHQQVAGAAAAAIWGRFEALFPRKRPTPKAVRKMHWSKLRAAGLSRQKRGYLKDLAAKFLDGTVEARRLPALPDEEVIAELTKVKGIGEWTAQMFLMFTLGRPDVFPAGDYGIVTGMRSLYGKPKATAKQLEALAEHWRPYRTTACWYVWQHKDSAAAAASDPGKNGKKA